MSSDNDTGQDLVEAAAAEAMAAMPNDVLVAVPLKYRKLLRYLALCQDEREACLAADVSYSYFQQMKQGRSNRAKAFLRAYNYLFTEPIEYARQDLMHLLPVAMNVYQQILEDDEVDIKTKHQAARDVLQANGLHKQTVEIEDGRQANEHDVKVYVRLVDLGQIRLDEVPPQLKEKVQSYVDAEYKTLPAGEAGDGSPDRDTQAGDRPPAEPGEQGTD